MGIEEDGEEVGLLLGAGFERLLGDEMAIEEEEDARLDMVAYPRAAGDKGESVNDRVGVGANVRKARTARRADMPLEGT